MEKLIITPKTKIYDLLESYPELEDLLISMAPQFQKLKNPILRKTVTKITNLSQASVIGGLKVEELVSRLRKEVGQTEVETLDTGEKNYVTEKPAWFNEENITETIDISEMLNAGEQPVHEVLSAMKKLGGGEVLKIAAPFIPAPLLDKSIGLNYKHWLQKIGENEFFVFSQNKYIYFFNLGF